MKHNQGLLPLSHGSLFPWIKSQHKAPSAVNHENIKMIAVLSFDGLSIDTPFLTLTPPSKLLTHSSLLTARKIAQVVFPDQMRLSLSDRHHENLSKDLPGLCLQTSGQGFQLRRRTQFLCKV